MGKTLPVHSVLWDSAGLTRIAEEMRVAPQTLVEELHRQNRDFADPESVREQQENWERLYQRWR
jgi:transposase